MLYVVNYGDEYLVDHGDGWTRWTTQIADAKRYYQRSMAEVVALLVGADVFPVRSGDLSKSEYSSDRFRTVYCGAI